MSHHIVIARVYTHRTITYYMCVIYTSCQCHSVTIASILLTTRSYNIVPTHMLTEFNPVVFPLGYMHQIETAKIPYTCLEEPDPSNLPDSLEKTLVCDEQPPASTTHTSKQGVLTQRNATHGQRRKHAALRQTTSRARRLGTGSNKGVAQKIIYHPHGQCRD